MSGSSSRCVMRALPTGQDIFRSSRRACMTMAPACSTRAGLVCKPPQSYFTSSRVALCPILRFGEFSSLDIAALCAAMPGFGALFFGCIPLSVSLSPLCFLSLSLSLSLSLYVDLSIYVFVCFPPPHILICVHVYIYIYIHIYIYVCVYIYICVCVCVCASS